MNLKRRKTSQKTILTKNRKEREKEKKGGNERGGERGVERERIWSGVSVSYTCLKVSICNESDLMW